MVDYGRDVNIGIPPADTQQVNVVASASITEALKVQLKEQVAAKIDETNLHLSSSRKIQEFILGESVDLEEGE